MSADQTLVRVALSDRSYDIEIGADRLASAAGFVTARRRCTHAVVIADQSVADTHAAKVAESFRQAGIRIDLFKVPSGEGNKTLASAERMWNAMVAAKADRKTIVVAVGGGVIGDLAGFVAATYTRGVSFVQIPTTLLAHVDSSVGGKVGVNLPQAKNMLGAFWQPLAVLIDTNTLKTLPEREYRSGLAEVVKYGVILDADFFGYLEEHAAALNERDPTTLRHVIARCCQLKAEVVAADEREETGLRAVLNYGHTFCHAIEAVAGYGQFLHGEAVSLGMMCAARLAERLGRIGPELRQRQWQLLTALRLPVNLPAFDNSALIAAMQHDKKVEYGQLRFILPSRMGHVELVGNVPAQEVQATLMDLQIANPA